MRKLSLFALAMYSFISLTAISCNDSTPQEKTVTKTTTDVRPPSKFEIEMRQKDSIRAKNIAETKAKEIPVGKENFEKLIAFIEKHGFTTDGGRERIPCGKQYTFYDKSGYRHAFLTFKTDSAGNPSMTGTVKEVIIYGYRNGIKNQEHFFPYRINSEKVFNDIPEIDGSWPEAEIVKKGYEEFLAKVQKSK